jgi:hypothetical protein
MRNNETSRGTESPKSAPLKGKKASGGKDDTLRDEEEEVEDQGRFALDDLDDEEDDLELADDESEDELEASDEEDEDEEFDEEDELDLEDEDSGSRLRTSDDLN